MKYMKRSAALLLTLLICLGLTACGKDPSGNTEDSGQAWVGATQYEGTFGDQGYYYIPTNQQSNLSYLDISTGLTTVLCTKAGCQHTEEQCEAFLIPSSVFGKGGMCFWNDSLYYLEITGYGINLVRCNATGTDLAVIGTLGDKYIEDQKTVQTKSFAQVENFWYYYAEVDGSVWNENEQRFENKQVLSYISRIDLRTGKEEILIEEADMLNFYAAKNDAVLFSTLERPDADILDRDTYREQLAKCPVLFKRWDGQTGQVSTLLEKKHSEFTGMQGVYDGKLYYYGTADLKTSLYVYDLETGKDALFADQEAMWFWAGGYAYCKDQETNGEWYILELKSGKKLPNDIEEGSIQFVCGSDQGCILAVSVIPADGGPREHRICYVPYTVLSDGLQETDLMRFYTWRNSV